MVAGGCGRIGYDELPEHAGPADGGPRPHDATASEATPEHDAADATEPESAPPEAGEDVVAEAEAGPDASPETGCTPSAAADYCQSLPPLAAAPVIDGLLDCGPTLVPIAPEDWRGAAPLPPFPSGNTAALAAAWRPDGLYVFIAVTTPVAIPADLTSQDYFGAGVELFVDDDGVFAAPGQYDNPGTIQMIVTSPPYAPPDAGSCPVDASTDGANDASGDAADAGADGPAEAATVTGQRAEIYRNEGAVGPWTSSQFGTFPTPTGFVFEGFFVAADLGLPDWSLSAGAHVGFDLAVDVSFPDVCTIGGEGHRAGQYFLNVAVTPDDAGSEAGPIGPPFADTRSFCTPTLASQ